MKFEKQLFDHEPDKKISGDCYRTAVGCILGKMPSEVPHFYEFVGDELPTGQEGRDKLRKYLDHLGLYPFQVPFDCDLKNVFHTMKSQNQDLPYLLSGESKSSCNHTVVCKNDSILWDPSKKDAGIIGPCDDGYFWVEVFAFFRNGHEANRD